MKQKKEGEVLVVEGGPTPKVKESRPTPGDQVEVIHYGNSRIEMKVSLGQPAFLTVFDTMMPGWQAYVNGQEVPLYHSQLLFRGIEIPPGQHKVVLTYVPPGFYLGATGSLLFWMTLVVVGVGFVIKRGRLGAPETQS